MLLLLILRLRWKFRIWLLDWRKLGILAWVVRTLTRWNLLWLLISVSKLANIIRLPYQSILRLWCLRLLHCWWIIQGWNWTTTDGIVIGRWCRFMGLIAQPILTTPWRLLLLLRLEYIIRPTRLGLQWEVGSTWGHINIDAVGYDLIDFLPNLCVIGLKL